MKGKICVDPLKSGALTNIDNILEKNLFCSDFMDAYGSKTPRVFLYKNKGYHTTFYQVLSIFSCAVNSPLDPDTLICLSVFWCEIISQYTTSCDIII